jgi:hypothetical protein
VRLSFKDPDYEGNYGMVVTTPWPIASFIAGRLFKQTFKTWASCKEFWNRKLRRHRCRIEAKPHGYSVFFNSGGDSLLRMVKTDPWYHYYDFIAEIWFSAK